MNKNLKPKNKTQVNTFKGRLSSFNHPILNIDILESGTRIITCDHTINNLLKRTEGLING